MNQVLKVSKKADQKLALREKFVRCVLKVCAVPVGRMLRLSDNPYRSVQLHPSIHTYL